MSFTKAIYGIYHISKDMWYIGQAVNPIQRLEEHKKGITLYGKESTQIIDLAIKEFGENDFKFKIFEGRFEDYNQAEKDFIKQYNSRFPKGYNQTSGGGGRIETKLSFEDILQIVRLLKTTEKEYEEIGKSFNISIQTISDLNNGRNPHYQNDKFPLRKYDRRKNLRKINPMQNTESRAKFTSTMKERYGVEHALQSKEIQQKMKEKSLAKYGVESPNQLKEKNIASLISRYRTTGSCGASVNLETNTFFFLQVDASEWAGLPAKSSSIYKNINGYQKSAGRTPAGEKATWRKATKKEIEDFILRFEKEKVENDESEE